MNFFFYSTVVIQCTARSIPCNIPSDSPASNIYIDGKSNLRNTIKGIKDQNKSYGKHCEEERRESIRDCCLSVEVKMQI